MHPLPDSWSPVASAAYLLLGIAIIDGVLHDEETDDVYKRLVRHDLGSEAALHEAVDLAWRQLQGVFGAGGMDAYLDSIERHCDRLKALWSEAELRALIDDLAQIAEVDGEVASAEIAYIAAVADHLGLELHPPGQ